MIPGFDRLTSKLESSVIMGCHFYVKNRFEVSLLTNEINLIY